MYSPVTIISTFVTSILSPILPVFSCAFNHIKMLVFEFEKKEEASSLLACIRDTAVCVRSVLLETVCLLIRGGSSTAPSRQFQDSTFFMLVEDNFFPVSVNVHTTGMEFVQRWLSKRFFYQFETQKNSPFVVSKLKTFLSSRELLMRGVCPCKLSRFCPRPIPVSTSLDLFSVEKML